MSQHDDRLPKPGDAEFAARVAARLRDGADSLDAQTRSRLNQARQAALDEMSPRPMWRSHWLTVGVTAAVAVVAFMVWQPVTDGPPPVTAAAPASLAAPDFELLMADEDLDMLEDLEFYTWLASTDLETGAAG